MDLKSTVIPTTFCIIDGKIIVDPSYDEEQLSSGKITIVINSLNEICWIEKTGGKNVSEAKLKECILIARKRCKFLLPKLF